MAVKEIHKPHDTPCPHQRSGRKGGCAIYWKRPIGCHHFACGWLRGSFPDVCRPDLSGVVAFVAPDQGRTVVKLEGIRPGALDTLEGRFIQFACQSMRLPIVLRPFQSLAPKEVDGDIPL